MKRRDFITTLGLPGLFLPANLYSESFKPKTFFKNKNIKVNDNWDVIVVGAGPAGCCAAISSAREGAKTLLIESSGILGGMGTTGLLNAWCPFSDGEKIIYKGLAERIFLESKKGVPHVSEKQYNWVPINAEYLKKVYDNLVTNSGASVLLFSQLCGVEMKDDETVDGLVISNKDGLTIYKAKVYIDCTGDGDLAAWAGADFKKGDEEGNVQQSTLCFTIANVDMDKLKEEAPLHSGNKKSPIHKMITSGRYPLIKDAHMNDKYIGGNCISFNAGHLTVDSTNPESLSQGMIKGRELADELYEGLKEFSPKAFGNSFLVSTAPVMGIRESRRIVCDYTFTIDDWLARKSFDDEIGRNNYYVDIHKLNAKQYERYKKGESHGIPFRIMLPKGINNVIVAGRCVSTDPYAFGSLRVMPPCLVTGEAAGVGGALSIKNKKINIHNIDIDYLRKRLKEEGQLI
ncbi:MAG: FAD-dependent oxidoreductase [Bacteroidales bacterium]|nr:FAD-dependent oxidoreductase [Bacteroidales bacterium]